MDDSKIPKLKRTVKAVVKKAARPDGPVDRGEFTMSIARQEISEAMGFEDDELEEKKWRKMVKELVQEALASLSSIRSLTVFGRTTMG